MSEQHIVKEGNNVLPNELPAGIGGGEMNAELNGNVATGGSAELPSQMMEGGKKHRRSKKSKKSKASKKSKKSKASKKSRRNKSRRK